MARRAKGSDGSLEAAFAHLRAGRANEALRLCAEILASEPRNALALYVRGLAAHGAGDLSGAAASLKAAIKCNPDYAEAHNALGVVLGAKGRDQQAIAAYRRAIVLRPDFADANYNLGIVLHRMGALDQAAAAYGHAIEIRPDHAGARNNLGNVFRDQGKLDEARIAFQGALSIAPQSGQACYNLATVLQEQERFDEAAEAYGRAIQMGVDAPEAHENAGAVLYALGRFDEAEIALRRAVEKRPDGARAHDLLGRALRELGRLDEAAAAFGRALENAPDDARYRIAFTATVESVFPVRFDARLKALLLRCFSYPEIDLQSLSNPSTGIIKTDPLLEPLIAASCDPDQGTFASRLAELSLTGPLSDALLLATVGNLVIPDPELERLLILLRRWFLDGLGPGGAPHARPSEHLAFLYALAGQCALNEYVYAASADEEETVDRLKRRNEDGALHLDRGQKAEFALLGCYGPLHLLGNAKALSHRARDAGDRAFSELIRVQIDEPRQDLRNRAEIAAFGTIEDPVSKAVRAQYEEHPYPRWTSVKDPAPTTAAARMRALFPRLEPGGLGKLEAPSILIAGCGTGKHAIESARHFAGARVLAVDLSLASLGFAARKARELGADNIEFMQGDILELDTLKRTFELVECVGTLHHMADPVRGWGTLVQLLNPGGFMKIGLYSEAARRPVVAARAFAAERGYGPNARDIRDFRREIMALEADHPVHRITLMRDFYSTSSCRDLVFHAHEHRFTLPQIAAILGDLNLEFLGFELANPAPIALYRAAFPDDSDLISLDNWHRFEDDHPDTFSGTYQFWTRKP
ncbi:MAG: tetratricopeptide repeat protein [Rhodospirillales bacterium]|nr:tetratricopeptide repeat protein [Rhodospirillales bacterium]